LLGEQLGLPAAVLDSLGAAYEQWDEHGWPGKLEGANVPLPARIAQLAEFVEVAHRLGGARAAAQLARKRGGKQFDPELAQLVATQCETLLAGIDSIATWDAVIDADPALSPYLSAE